MTSINVRGYYVYDIVKCTHEDGSYYLSVFLTSQVDKQLKDYYLDFTKEPYAINFEIID